MGLFDFFKTSAPNSVSVKKLTTYLGTLFKEHGVDPSTLPYNGSTIDFSSVPNFKPREIMGQYEAALTQATYMSRIAYNSNMQKLPAVQLINENPLVFNTGLSMIRRHLLTTYKSQNGFKVKSEPFIGNGTVLYDKKISHETPCYLQVVDYKNMTANCPYPGKKVLYITFRGTLSLKSAFLTDANITSRAVTELLKQCSMDGISGTGAFRHEVYETAASTSIKNKLRINPFGIHQGFILNLRGIIGDICTNVDSIASNESIDRIIITGHSLGAANATVASLILGGFKRAGVASLQKPTIHCISFGAPKLFLDYTRNVYNSLLDGGYITIDRVANRMKNLAVGLTSMGVAIDLVPTIPPNFVHPGYMIRKQEIKTQSRTGRSKNITDIREMFAGISPSREGLLGGIKSFSEFNGLPTYPEFLRCFSSPDSEYEKLISYLPFGTLYPIPGKKQETYDYTKGKVSRIFNGESIEDTSESADEAAAKKAAAEEGAINAAAAGAVAEEESSEGVVPEQTGGGPLKNIYDKATSENGPNHVVYSCRKNISPFSCHLGYMGVSYGGLSIDSVGYSPPPLSFFIKEGDSTMVYTIPQKINQIKQINKINKTNKINKINTINQINYFRNNNTTINKLPIQNVNSTSSALLSNIEEGTEMVNFHDEYKYGRYYTRKNFNGIITNRNTQKKRNPTTRQPIETSNAKRYRAHIVKKGGSKTRRAKRIR